MQPPSYTHLTVPDKILHLLRSKGLSDTWYEFYVLPWIVPRWNYSYFNGYTTDVLPSQNTAINYGFVPCEPACLAWCM